MIRTCFPRFYIDVLHPKRPLLEVHRYEVEVAQESFLRHFPAKQGNPWRNDDILEALADFGIKAQSRTEKIALKTVLSEHEAH
eukprot:symbB.v1.2.041651.t1/scaffold8452.1/size6286/1